MKNVIVLFLMILPFAANAQKNDLSVFENLLKYEWIAESDWDNKGKFKQEVSFEFNLDKSAIHVRSSGFTNKEQSEYGLRNFGVRWVNTERSQIEFAEYDVFGAKTEGVVTSNGKDLFYTYQYDGMELTDAWEYVHETKYNFKIGKRKNGKWEKILLESSFSAKQKNKKEFDKKVYQNDIKVAKKYVKENDHENAAKSYIQAFAKQNNKGYSHHKLDAATEFALSGREVDLMSVLNTWIKEATSSDMEELRTNLVFSKYHETQWWQDLDKSMDVRREQMIAHHQNLKIFKKGRIFTYSAIRITKDKDTVANTFIEIIPDGTGWGSIDASSQSQVVFKYKFEAKDSLEHIQELKEVVTEEFWIRDDTTGVIENEKEFWIHPMRNNEFFKTEIAPFPQVKYPINYETMLDAGSKIYLMKNWGTYSPSLTEQKYFYLGKESKDYAFLEKLECHKFTAYGHNSVHGISHLEYFFNEDYGFTEMNYLTYDGDLIQFTLVNVID